MEPIAPIVEVDESVAATAAETTPATTEPTETVAPAEPTQVVAPAEKTYTQAEIDRMVEDRVAAARAEFETSTTPSEPAATELDTPAAPAPEGDKRFTQADMDRHAAVAVNRTKQEFRDYAELKQRVSEMSGLTDQLQTTRTELETSRSEAAAKDSQILRLEVALDHKLPKELAVRLTGLTREEVEADAAALTRLTGVTAGGFGGGPSVTDGTAGNDFNSEIRSKAGFTPAGS